MNNRSNLILTLVAVLLMAACTPGGVSFNYGSKPVSAQNRVIYQLNVGAFTTEGTFAAAQNQLPRLDSLGVDILWLMPIYPRGATMNSPYASMNFKAVNPSYGTVADLRSFVAAAHQRGLKVWLDWVPNHVAVENPWVQSHPEYFTTDESGNMIHPHGWGDVFELNYQSEGLVNEMNSALKFWIDSADVDGFRCDYVSSPTIPVKYWTDLLAELRNYKQDKQIEFLSETDITNRYNHRIDSCGFDYDYAWDFQEDLVRHFGAEGNLTDSLRTITDRLLAGSATVSNRRMVYLTNHDQNYNDGGHTLANFYGDNRYLLTALEFTFYGMPLIYQGQEIGDPDTLNYFTDGKVQWAKVDTKMLNTVRSLIALHHTEASLAADVPVSYLKANSSSVFAYRRGNVVVALNLGSAPADVQIEGIDAGNYTLALDSKTIANTLSNTDIELSNNPTLTIDAKGYQVLVKH